MTGKQKKRDQLFSYSVHLESRIPATHYLRRVKKVLDLSFVSSEVKACYGYNGNESVDPEVIVKLMLLLDSVRKGCPELLQALRHAYQREAGKLEEREPAARNEEDDSGGSGGGSGYDPINDHLLCMTDPEAAMVRHGKMPARPRYKSHRAVDEACGVIVAVETTAGDVAENRKLFDLVEQSEANTGVAVETVVGDCPYGTNDNFRECAERGIASHLGEEPEAGSRDFWAGEIYLCRGAGGLSLSGGVGDGPDGDPV